MTRTALTRRVRRSARKAPRLSAWPSSCALAMMFITIPAVDTTSTQKSQVFNPSAKYSLVPWAVSLMPASTKNTKRKNVSDEAQKVFSPGSMPWWYMQRTTTFANMTDMMMTLNTLLRLKAKQKSTSFSRPEPSTPPRPSLEALRASASDKAGSKSSSGSRVWEPTNPASDSTVGEAGLTFPAPPVAGGETGADRLVSAPWMAAMGSLVISATVAKGLLLLPLPALRSPVASSRYASRAASAARAARVVSKADTMTATNRLRTSTFRTSTTTAKKFQAMSRDPASVEAMSCGRS